MKPNRIDAVKIGILFLIALIFNLIATNISDPIIGSADYLSLVYPNKSTIVTANILNLICAVAMIFIPIVLLRVVKKEYEKLAIIYVVFRFLEGILFIYLAIKSLSIINLSREFINSSAQNSSTLKILADSIKSESQWAINIYIIVFCSGAAAFYSLLYKSKLVTRVLSVWGILATALLFVGAVLGIFSLGMFEDIPLMKGMVYFAPPIALNEFFLSMWLIVKGFNADVPRTA